MLHAETLYWVFSTIPQVLAALVGILAAFAHFRIVRLHELLLQEAYVPSENWESYGFNKLIKEKEKFNPNPQMLKNAIKFKNFTRIEEVFEALLKRYEKHESKDIAPSKENEGIIRDIHRRYKRTSRKIEHLRWITFSTAGAAIFAIFISLISLSYVEPDKIYCITNVLPLLSFVFTMISLGGAVWIVYLGLIEKADQEK